MPADLIFIERPAGVGQMPPADAGPDAHAGWQQDMLAAGGMLTLEGEEAVEVLDALGHPDRPVDPEQIDRMLSAERALARRSLWTSGVRDWLEQAARHGGFRVRYPGGSPGS